jgi:flagellar basal-body rod modification protein FlgD
MTTISPTSTAGAATAGSITATAKGTTLDSTAFLKLLIAELKNQDPTKPMDSTQMVAQLSSFSQVEQAAATNTKLGSILDALTAGQAAGLLGRTISPADGAPPGVVEAVRISEKGPIAVLADGSEVLVTSGVSVRR